MNFDDVIKDCKFLPKPNTWFIEGSEVICIGNYSSNVWGDSDGKFKTGWGLFSGLTMERYVGYTGELPRQDEETCTFDEFYIFDKFGNEISEFTLNEYKAILRDSKINSLYDK